MSGLFIGVEKRTDNPFIVKDGIFYNGLDNQYPDKIYILVENSPTSSACLDLCKKNIIGNGFGESDDINSFLVNYSNNLTLHNLLEQITTSLILFKEAVVKAIYSIDSKGFPIISSLKFIDNRDFRYCYKDDNSYISHIAYSQNFSTKKVYKKYTRYSIYNENILLDAIIKKDVNKKWDENDINQLNKSGVVFILRAESNKDIYLKSRIHPVMNDCLIEEHASLFKKNGITRGHFGRNIVVLDEKVENFSISDSRNSQKNIEDEENEQFKKLLGASGVGGVLVYRTRADDLSKAIYNVKIDTDITPDLFKDTEVTARENITSIFFNTPIGLIRSSEALFGNSGEAYKQMRLFLQENTLNERKMVHYFLKKILGKMPRFVEKFKELPEITPLIKE